MVALVFNRRNLLAAGGSILATGVSGLLMPARAQGLAPTSSMSPSRIKTNPSFGWKESVMDTIRALTIAVRLVIGGYRRREMIQDISRPA